MIRTPVTVTPLLICWLSLKHNLIDLATKAFPASESKNTCKKVKEGHMKLQMYMNAGSRSQMKVLIATNEKNKNRALQHGKRTWHHSYNV